MDERVHVTHCCNKVQKEISFIFPNYIHEPILCPEQIKFCSDSPLFETIVNTWCDIVTNPEKDTQKHLKEKLHKSLILTKTATSTLPCITNQCCHNLRLNAQDVTQQTDISCLKNGKDVLRKCFSSDLSKDCSSLNFTTSSCISCSGFDNGVVCLQEIHQKPLEEVIKARTASLEVPTKSSSSAVTAEEEDVLEDHEAAENSYDDLAEHEGDLDALKGSTFDRLEILLVSDVSAENNMLSDNAINISERISNEENIELIENTPSEVEENEETNE